jgi:hypothetical protein
MSDADFKKSLTCKIEKVDEKLGIVFAWASVTRDSDGAEVWDLENDNIPTAVLEKAAYDFVLSGGTFNELHSGAPVGRVAEAFMLTDEKRKVMKAMLEKGEGFWVAAKVENPTTLAKIMSGELKALSIEGSGVRESV